MAVKPLLAAWCLSTCVIGLAAPAPWFTWQSKLDGKVVCAQTSPGNGWQQLAGPFADARCGRA